MSLLATWLLEAAMILGMDAKADGGSGAASAPANGARIGSPAGKSLKILIVTDAWSPQVNGVVRTLEMLGRELTARGHRVRYATAENHTTLPLPTYPEIRLALFPRQTILDAIDGFAPDAIHIATEGTMGLSARAICLERGLRFTTSFHTRFPDYVHARFPFIPESAVYGALRTFHAAASATMVSTLSLKRELEAHGFANVLLWSRGVDVEQFRPLAKDHSCDLGVDVSRPVFLYVGRLSVEKNVEAFLSLDLPGTKLVVGEGPQRGDLETRFPAARFLGQRMGDELARIYASSDVFVFPSRTDTFGLVLLEALASGTPVAAYPVQGPLDVLCDSHIAALDEDLHAACLHALTIGRDDCRAFALTRSWGASTEQFLVNLALAG
jgi:glycosyltransferase involved in cell wall biosynthesis